MRFMNQHHIVFQEKVYIVKFMKKILTSITIFLLPLVTFAQVNQSVGPAYQGESNCGTPCVLSFKQKLLIFIYNVDPTVKYIAYFLILFLILKIVEKITNKKIISNGKILLIFVVFIGLIILLKP